MTRQHAAKRLLEHGPLMFHQFVAITGWSPSVARYVLGCLRRGRVARHLGQHREFTVWRLV